MMLAVQPEAVHPRRFAILLRSVLAGLAMCERWGWADIGIGRGMHPWDQMTSLDVLASA